MKARLVRWIFLLLIGLGIGSAIGYYQAQDEMEGGSIPLSPDAQGNATILKKSSKSTTKSSSAVGGDFALIDHTGKDVTQADYADSYKMIFFGFTYCPAVCPTELQKVNLILDELGEMGEKITPIFITVDPERDNVEVMKEYVEQFHPRLIGLTGSQEQIDAVKAAYRVYANKVENDMMDEYMMDHSAFLYFMSPENTLVAMYPSKDTAVQIAEDIKAKDL